MDKPTFVKSVQTQQLESLLQSVEVGQTVTYEELSQCIAGNVQQECRGYLQSARKTLSKQGVEFGTITNVGLKRLNPDEVVDSTATYTQRARRVARKARDRLTHVVMEELSEEKKKDLLAHASQLQVIEMFGTAKARKKIADKSTEAGQLNIGQTLELFK